MRILEMEATFGKLDHAHLAFGPGLSVITAPNEWGKSTWCAFLTAMLYGVDTRERSTKTSLSVKEQYAPWSGKPMEGVLHIEHQGRRITIERKSGKAPLGEFRAYETDTGLPIAGMTGENCGEMLLGVEKSVFCRSAFVKFSDLPVEADEALHRRLNALVTTGDESGSGERLGKKLGDLKRRIRYNKNGLLPETQRNLMELRSQLQQIEVFQQRLDAYRGEIDRGEHRMRELKLHAQMCEYEASREQRSRLEDAAQQAKDARDEVSELEQTCADAPDQEVLKEKLRQGYDLRDQLQAPVEVSTGSAAPVIGLAAAAVGCILVGVILWMRQMTMPGILTVIVGMVLGAIGAIVAARRSGKQHKQNQEVAQREERLEELDESLDRWEAQQEALAQLQQAQMRMDQAKQRLQDLLAVSRNVPRPAGEDHLNLSAEQTQAEMERLEGNLRAWRSQADQLQGQMEALPRQETLQQQITAAQSRQRELERYYRAIEYSQAALETAQQELQRRFVPRITRRAEELLTRLTGGRYRKLSIGEDLTLSAAREEETTMHTSRWRSDGTADQMYLALRLAVWEVLCPSAPLILDDALIRFDEKRMGYALEVLQELGKTSQILLFTCQNREETFLSK